MKKLLDKIEEKKGVAGIIGLGYVGLPIALRFCDAGFKTIGFDIDIKKVVLLDSGKSYLEHIPGGRIKERIDEGLFTPTSDFSLLSKCDIIIIAVPTPLTESNDPDLSFVINTTKTIAQYLKKGQAISLESTTYPGTTREELLTRFDSSSMKAGVDYFLIYSPEREDPGNKHFEIRSIPKVVGGITENCLEVGKAIYGAIVKEVVPVSSTETAEMSKLLENIFRGVNIALVNELKMLTDKMGINIWEVVKASSTKPFGFMPFYPGPGLGGHCIPIDPYYLSWKAKQYDFSTRFIELAGEVNTHVPHWIVEKTASLLNGKKKSLNGSNILIIGAAYKKGVNDTRESPAVSLINLFTSADAKVRYHDPHVPVLSGLRKLERTIKSTPLTVKNIEKSDVVIIVTDHDEIDYNLLVKHSDLLIDTRNATSRVKGKKRNVHFA